MQKLIERVRKNTFFSLFVLLFIVICFAIFVSFQLFAKNNPAPFPFHSKTQGATEEQKKIVLPEEQFRRYIDGIFTTEDKINLPLAAVTIDNIVDARPHSGIEKASLVYESLTEGGITRFLAIYALDEREIEEIGPVRSARDYFVDWAKEYDALYVHVGGSPQSLRKIYREKIFDLDQFYYSGYFWRSSQRLAPHNVYTSLELLKKAREKFSSKKLTPEQFEPWLFKEDLEEDKRPQEEKNLTIHYSTYNYEVGWKYDRTNNEYLRFGSQKPYLTASGEEIKAKNIIVQYVRTWVIDKAWRRKMEIVGEGEAVVFLDGKVYNGKWKKSEENIRTRFYDEQDKEIEFNAGPTWIEVVPTGTKITNN